MSETKFTPGPWRHYAQPDPFDAKLKRSYVLYGEPDAVNPDDGTFPPDQCVCGCGKSHWSCGDGNNSANAQLISCAPEMYKVLEKVLGDQCWRCRNNSDNPISRGITACDNGKRKCPFHMDEVKNILKKARGEL